MTTVAGVIKYAERKKIMKYFLCYSSIRTSLSPAGENHTIRAEFPQLDLQNPLEAILNSDAIGVAVVTQAR